MPEAYRRAEGDLGPAVYTPTDDPRRSSSAYREGMKTELLQRRRKQLMVQWGAAWTPMDPIESILFKLEELYIQAVIAEVPYTQAQLLDQALDKNKKTGLFIQTNITWNALLPNEKNWANFKTHFARAYDSHLERGTRRGPQDIMGRLRPLATTTALDQFPTPSHKCTWQIMPIFTPSMKA